jgi:hypothetical protein
MAQSPISSRNLARISTTCALSSGYSGVDDYTIFTISTSGSCRCRCSSSLDSSRFTQTMAPARPTLGRTTTSWLLERASYRRCGYRSSVWRRQCHAAGWCHGSCVSIHETPDGLRARSAEVPVHGPLDYNKDMMLAHIIATQTIMDTGFFRIPPPGDRQHSRKNMREHDSSR